MLQIYIFLMVLLPILVGIPIYYIGLRNQKANNERKYLAALITAFINLAAVICAYSQVSRHILIWRIPKLIGVGITFQYDLISFIFTFITALVWFVVILYSRDYMKNQKKSNRFYAFLMITLGSTQGIFLMGDLLLLVVFFEIMSFSSYVLVVHDESKTAMEAGRLYLYMAIAGSLFLLLGIFYLYYSFGTLEVDLLKHVIHNLGNQKYFVAFIFIIGFGVKAGIVPLHIWLPEAHPAAPTPASAILSGVLIKCGVFGIYVATLWMFVQDTFLALIVIGIGVVTMLLGGVAANFQNNVKKILAYSSVSQIGYIMIGLGIALYIGQDETIAYVSSLYHIFNHAIFKAALFLSVGSVYLRTHKLDLRENNGFGKLLPITMILYIIAMAGISGIPGFNGYVSKTLLHEGILEAARLGSYSGFFSVVEISFTIAGGLTFCYLLKILKEVFLDKLDTSKNYLKEKALPYMLVALSILAVFIVVLGLFPDIVNKLFMDPFLKQIGLIKANTALADIDVYHIHALMNIGISLLIGLGLFLLLYLTKMQFAELPDWLNVRYLVYRPIGRFVTFLFYSGFGFLDIFCHKAYELITIFAAEYDSTGVKRPRERVLDRRTFLGRLRHIFSSLVDENKTLVQEGYDDRKHKTAVEYLSRQKKKGPEIKVYESLDQSVQSDRILGISKRLDKRITNLSVFAPIVFLSVVLLILLYLILRM